MTKTTTTPSTTQTISPQEREEKLRFPYSGVSKQRVAQSTGTPKTPSDLYAEAHAQALIHEAQVEAALILKSLQIQEAQARAKAAMEAVMRSEEEEKRFRSFAERYVIERAGGLVNPLKDGFDAVCDAKAIYKMIDNAAVEYRPDYSAGVTGAQGAVGMSQPQSAPPAVPIMSVIDAQQMARHAYEAGRMARQASPLLPDAAKAGAPPPGAWDRLKAMSKGQKI
jgi:hypothetical protein